MKLFTAPLFTLFPFISHHYFVAAASDRRIEERQDQDDSFCFGENSICVFSNNLWSECQNYLSDNDDTEWYKCICGNGYVSVEEECNWCQAAYNLPYFDDSGSNIASCSSIGVTVAPIPSSILVAESQYNKTYTGVISGANPTSTGLSGSAATTTNASVTALQTTNSTATRTAGTGATSVVTLNGGNQGGPTTTPPSNLGGSRGSLSTATVSTAKVGSGSSGTEVQKSGFALLFSFVVFGLSLLDLI